MKTVSNKKDSNKINSLKKLGQKFKWFLFTEFQDFKLTSDYINFICPCEKKKTSDQIQELRNLIKQSLIREFSPKIQNYRSYELLVDSVMYKIQKNALQNDSHEFFQ